MVEERWKFDASAAEKLLIVLSSLGDICADIADMYDFFVSTEAGYLGFPPSDKQFFSGKAVAYAEMAFKVREIADEIREIAKREQGLW